MTYSVSKMRLTLKRILQAFFLAVLFSFSTLAMFRTLAGSPTNSASSLGQITVEQEKPSWMKNLVGLLPDRSLRSVHEEEANYSPPLNSEKSVLNESVLRFEASNHSQSMTTVSKSHATLDDLFISVKTTKNFHPTRLDVIIKTWFTLAREQVTVFKYFHYFGRCFHAQLVAV